MAKKFQKPSNPFSIAKGNNLSGERYQAMYNKESKAKKKGMRGALKSLQYKPQTKKGQYKSATKKLQGKTDSASKGAASVFSMMRKERAQSARGGGGTASAVANPRTKKGLKPVGPKNLGRSGQTTASGVKKTYKSAGQKGIKAGRKAALKAQQYKPVANKNKQYNKLDRMSRTAKGSAEKTGNVRQARRAEGVSRAVSLLRQEAAMARRGKSKKKK
jgi:hypothetical protein